SGPQTSSPFVDAEEEGRGPSFPDGQGSIEDVKREPFNPGSNFGRQGTPINYPGGPYVPRIGGGPNFGHGGPRNLPGGPYPPADVGRGPNFGEGGPGPHDEREPCRNP
ncbi:unnamed protein product, partial [Rotaria sp. Silwood2]